MTYFLVEDIKFFIRLSSNFVRKLMLYGDTLKNMCPVIQGIARIISPEITNIVQSGM